MSKRSFLMRVDDDAEIKRIMEKSDIDIKQIRDEAEFFIAKLNKIKEKAKIQKDQFWNEMYPELKRLNLIEQDYTHDNDHGYSICIDGKDRCIYKEENSSDDPLSLLKAIFDR